MICERVNEMDFTQAGTVGAIVVICYLIGECAKQIPFIKNEAIPVIVGIFGGIIGVVGMYAIPDFPVNDVLNAVAVGIVSGLASTGVNQIYKQTQKGKDE